MNAQRFFGIFTASTAILLTSAFAQGVPWDVQNGGQLLGAYILAPTADVRTLAISGQTAMVEESGTISFYERSPYGWFRRMRSPNVSSAAFARQMDISGDVAIANSYDDDGRPGDVTIWRYRPYPQTPPFSGWIEEPIENGPSSAGSVAIEGDVAVIGHPSQQSAWVFRFDPQQGSWRFEKTLFISLQQDLLGPSVAISGDVIVVGTDNAAHVFRAPSWNQEANLPINNCPTNCSHTSTVEISGDVIVAAVKDEVNSRRVMIYEYADGAWSTTNFPGFGTAVDVDGDVIMIGNNEDFGTSNIDFYQRGELRWVQKERIGEPGNFDFSTGFGRYVALSNDQALFKTFLLGGTFGFHETVTLADLSFRQSVNQQPELSAPNTVTALAGQPVSFTVTATDPEGDPLEIRAYYLPTGASFDGETFSWTMPADPNLVSTVAFVAWQTRSPFLRSQQRTVAIRHPPPEMAPTQSTLVFGNATLGGSAQQTFDVTNTGGATLVVSRIESTNPNVFAASPNAFSLDRGQTQTVTLTFAPSGPGFFGGALSIVSNAADSPRTVAINAKAGFPEFADRPIAALPALVGEPLSFRVTAHRAGTLEPLPVTVEPLPTGASFAGGEFTWIPTPSQVGTYVLQFEASDPQSGLSVSHLVSLTATQVLVDEGKLELTQAINASFGQTLAADRDVALIGLPAGNGFQYEGSAFAFRRIDGTWTQQQRFLPPPGSTFESQHGRFGHAVAVSGDRAIIGAPGRVDFHTLRGKAYIYRYSNGAWIQEVLLQSDPQSSPSQDNFGSVVDIDGDLAVVSTNLLSGAREVYVFRRNADGWTREAVLQAPPGQTDAEYGASIAVEDDLIAVGAPGQTANQHGAIYIYRFDGANWSSEETIQANHQYPDILGFQLGRAVDIDGGRIAVGEQRRAHVLHYEANRWQGTLLADQLGTSIGSSFGESISISGDVVAVGASDVRLTDATGTLIEGAVFLYREESPGNWLPTLVQKNDEHRINDDFGQQVAISGGRLIVADRQHAGGLGAVYAFALPFAEIEPPVVINPGTQVVTEGQLLRLDVAATDPDPLQTTTITATGLPQGAAFDGTTLTWTPTLDQAGTHTAVFTATDNGAPPLSSAPLSVTIVVNDAVPVGAEVISTPVDPETGATPVQLAFEAVTGPGKTTLAVQPSGPPPPSTFKLGDPPVFIDIETTAAFDGVIEVQFSYASQTFADESALRLFHYENGAWVDITTAIDTQAKLITGETTSLSPFAVFQSTNQPPALTALADQTAREGQVLVVEISASDPDGDPPILSAQNLPPFALFINEGEGTGSIVLAPGFADKGIYDNLTVIASDGIAEDRVSFALEVVDVNAAPSFAAGEDAIASEDAGPQTVAGWASEISPGAADEAAQALSFVVGDGGALFAQQPAIDPSGILTFTPAPNAHGTATLAVRLGDNGGTQNGGIDSSAVAALTIVITPVNDSPLAAAGLDTSLECIGPLTTIQLDGSGSSDLDGDELAFTWTDATSAAIAAGVDPAVELPLGQHLLTLIATDPSGATHSDLVIVTIEDTTAPTLTLAGPDTLILECPAPYVEPGATASDICDENPELVIDTSALDTDTPGDYTVTYTATDASGNQAVATRLVQVIDTTPPVLTLQGDAEVTVECSFPYDDPGATALDNCDGDLTEAIVTSNPVDTAVPGIYTVTYQVSDASDNAAETLTRTVTVVDTTPPTLTLNDTGPIRVELGTAFLDPGASALDLCDGDLTEAIITTDSVDVHSEGTYPIVYTVTDAAGNATSLTRTVEIVVTPNSYVLVAAHSLHIKEHATVHSGFVGVIDYGQRPFLADQVELSIGTRALTAPSVRISSPRVRVKNRAAIAGTLVYDELNRGSKSTIAQETTPGQWPLFVDFGLPPFLHAAPGAVDVEVKKKKIVELAPEDGPFGQIKVKQQGILILSGGEYHIDELDIGNKAAVLIQAPTTLLINGHVGLDQQSYFGPENTTVDPSQITLYVAGENGRAKKSKDKSEKGKKEDEQNQSTSRLKANPRTVQVGVKAIFAGNVYAPNGTVYLRQQSQSTGSFIARDLILGNNAEVHLRSGWQTPGVAYDPPQLVAKLAFIPPDGSGALVVDNYPNPFNPATTIRYLLPTTSQVELKVYNALGQMVKVLVDQPQPMGIYRIEWDGREQNGQRAASGIYFYRLQSGGHAQTGRMLLIK